MRRKIFIGLICAIALFASNHPAYSRKEVVGEIINVNHHYKIAFTDLNSSSLRSGDLVKIIKDGRFVTYLEVSEASSAITKLIPVEGRGGFNTTVDFNRITVGAEVLKVDDNGASIQASAPVPAEAPPADKSYGPKPSKGAVVSRDSQLKEDFGLRRPNSDVAVSKSVSRQAIEPKAVNQESANSEQYAALSENYAKLSKSFARLMDEKKTAELKYEESFNEVQSLRLEVQQLTGINASLKDEIRALEMKQASLRNDDTKRQLNEMRETITQLKKKLERMTNLLKGTKMPYEE